MLRHVRIIAIFLVCLTQFPGVHPLVLCSTVSQPINIGLHLLSSVGSYCLETMTADKEFDLILLGPTGYTGKLTAEHIVQHFPTNLKWALAGRSATKVQAVAAELKNLNPDRAEPDQIITERFNSEVMDSLVRRTRVIINCVGPFHLYSTPVVEACAKSGTHYVDVTGETPWIKQIIEKYHETAKSNGAVIIPSAGFESAPPDILAWALINFVRTKLSADPVEVVGAIYDIKAAGPSGGTLNTILTIIETLKLSDLAKFADPYALAASPPPPTRVAPKKSLAELILGLRSVPDLGTLTTSPSGHNDETIVNRSSTLLPDFYGPKFSYRHFLHVRNAFIGVAFHYAFIIGIALLLLPPVRWIVRRFVYAPGQGPSREESRNDMAELRTVVTAVQEGEGRPKRAVGSLSYQGGMYQLAGVTVSEAARVILEHEDEVRQVSGGGIVTTATLGQYYVDRLEKAGLRIQTKLLD
ncbi:hypothetical protein VTN77DRAFT_5205 [Rasamsonia byssochlamydoides]|uniref:uncharacterized protein n=1 Tax=Rasamsonia byssochlamydoides TaxID=89139 RepID=UPI0037441768